MRKDWLGNRLDRERRAEQPNIEGGKAHRSAVGKLGVAQQRVQKPYVRPAILIWVVFFIVLATHVRLVLRYSYPIPFWDESRFIPYITNFRPITLNWLWSQANEHRILIHRLTYVGIVKLFGLDSRIFNSLSVLLLGATAALALWVLARLRGALSYSDAFVVAVLLHLGHYPNTLWPIQMGFVLVTCLFCATILLIVCSEGTPRMRHIAVVGTMVVAMCLCGAHGLPAAVMLSLYLVWTAIQSWSKSRPAAMLSLGFAIASYALVVFYFVGYEKYRLQGRPFSIRNSLVEALKALSTSLGPYAAKLGPYGAAAVALLSLGTAALLFSRLWRADDRDRAVGLLLGLVALCGLALGIGYGRAILGPGAGFEGRYATFMTPLLLIIYLSFSIFDTGTAGKVMRVLLFIGAWLLFWPNSTYQMDELRDRYEDGRTLVKEARAGMPIRKLALDYGPRWMFTPEIFEQYMRMLASARMGIYRRYPPPDRSSELLQNLSEHFEIKGSDTNGQLFPLANHRLQGGLGLMAQPVSRCDLRVDSPVRRVRLGFGILPGELSKDVEFRLSVQAAGRTEALWSRTLNATLSSDRGVQHAGIDLAAMLVPGTRVVFETMAVGVEPSGAEAFWTDVSLE